MWRSAFPGRRWEMAFLELYDPTIADKGSFPSNSAAMKLSSYTAQDSYQSAHAKASRV